MGLFSKNEVVFIKESNATEEQLQKLLHIRDYYDLPDEDKKNLEKDIVLTEKGIEGEKKYNL